MTTQNWQKSNAQKKKFVITGHIVNHYYYTHSVKFVYFQIKDEVQKNKQEYMKLVDRVRTDRAKYEDVSAKGKSL